MAKKRKSGNGTVRHRKDGRWEGRHVIGYCDDFVDQAIEHTQGKQKSILQIHPDNFYVTEQIYD